MRWTLVGTLLLAGCGARPRATAAAPNARPRAGADGRALPDTTRLELEPLPATVGPDPDLVRG